MELILMLYMFMYKCGCVGDYYDYELKENRKISELIERVKTMPCRRCRKKDLIYNSAALNGEIILNMLKKVEISERVDNAVKEIENFSDLWTKDEPCANMVIGATNMGKLKYGEEVTEREFKKMVDLAILIYKMKKGEGV